MSATPSENSFEHKSFLKQLTEKPGVYRMLDKAGDVIYVGKAKNLKKRVSSYFNKQDSAVKTQVMVKQICAIEVTVTNTETEALLLENNTIKQLKPRYNVLFRDDKSYPYVFLSASDYPRLEYHRGARKEKGDYFGPFPSSSSVRHSLSLLQKLFRVRQCEDSVFRNRSRPCLQYQIKRCTAPCVNYISQDDYAKDVQLTRLFYQGKNEEVIDQLKERMEVASTHLEFEVAAQLRDQIIAMRKVVETQVISGKVIDLDVFALDIKAGMAAVVVLFIRQGKVLGSKQYFPRAPKHVELADLTEGFITQFYLAGKEVPQEIVVNQVSANTQLLSSGLEVIANRKVRVTSQVRSDRAGWLKLAQQNVEQALVSKLNLQTNQKQKLVELQKSLHLPILPEHMECFDISHTMGEGTVASCVVFIDGVPDKSKYRRFNIKDIEPGDDYAAIAQAVSRRYARLIKEDAQLPQLILIDGGKGQLNKAVESLAELGLSEMHCISVAKGVERKLGMEQIYWPHKELPTILPSDSSALHLIQHIRDESHRFAIAGHRAKRGKQRTKSWLEEIDGIGPKKRKELLNYFGGLQAIESASIDDLMKVKGIQRQLAETIYYRLHEN